MRRKLITLLFFVCFCAKALSGGGSIADVLLALHTDPTKGYKQAEELYTESRDIVVASRLATILAFAPVSDIKTKPYLYAKFAFYRDLSLPPELKIKMAKLAGEGFFNESQFKEAKNIFQSALEIKGLSDVDKEYFVYQLAWTYINLGQPQLAIERMSQFLSDAQAGRLRKEMITDLGKAFALCPADKKPRQPLVLSNDEQHAFVDGYVGELARARVKGLSSDTKWFAQTGDSELLTAWLKAVFLDARLSKIAACKKIENLELAPEPNWPKSFVLLDLRQCTKEWLRSPLLTISPNTVAIYGRLQNLEPIDLLLLSSVWEARRQFDGACSLRLKALQDSYSKGRQFEIPPDELLDSTLNICKNSLDERLRQLPKFISGISGNSELEDRYYKPLLLNPKRSWIWRRPLWLDAPAPLALEANIVLGIGRELLLDELQIQRFILDIESRAQRSIAVAALLRVRAGVTLPYDTLSSISDWGVLSKVEAFEVLDNGIRSETLTRFLADWSKWKLFFEREYDGRRIFYKITELVAGAPAGSIQPLAQPRSEQEQAINQIIARKMDPTILFNKEWVFDAKPLNATALAHVEIQKFGLVSQSLKEAEKALNKTAIALKMNRQHRWKTKRLVEQNIADLKLACSRLGQALKAGTGEDAEVFHQLAEVVNGWSSKL